MYIIYLENVIFEYLHKDNIPGEIISLFLFLQKFLFYETKNLKRQGFQIRI